MNWRWIRQFPKYALAGFLLLGSTALFAVWWFLQRPGAPQQAALQEDPAQAERRRIAESLPARLGSLVMVDADLYDVSSGERLFPNWLGGTPRKVFHHADSNHFIAIAERGLMRFAMDGSRAGALASETPPVYTHDLRQAVFVRGGDLWMAGVDWQRFAFENQRQVTHYGQFFGPGFAVGAVLISPKALVVRNLNQWLWVSLETGEFKPVDISTGDIVRRRSPDGRFLIGDEDGAFFLYDVETNERRSLHKDSERAREFLWLDNGRCVVIADRNRALLFDRENGSVQPIATLPTSCDELKGAAPGGRFAVWDSNEGLQILDLGTGQTEPFGKSAQDFLWVGEDRLLCSVEAPDSSIRGTWMKRMGEEWQRLLPAPYLARQESRAAVVLKSSGQIVFGTATALWRVESDGSGLQEIAKLARPAAMIETVEDWGETARN